MKTKLPLLIAATLLMLSCAKEEKDVLPNVPVYFTIFLNDPAYIKLQATGTSLKVRSYNALPVGYRGNGIIVINGVDGFHAYDATCTNPSCLSSSAQSVDIVDELFALCPACKTRYSLLSGYATNFKARHLKEYQTMQTGYQLNVHN